MLTMLALLARGHHAGSTAVVHVQRADQVDRDQLVPLLGLGLGERQEYIPAGIVDQHVDLAQAGHHGGGDTGSVNAAARSVMSQATAMARPPAATDVRRPPFRRPPDRDRKRRPDRAFLREAPARGAADAAAAAGDDGHFVL